MNDETNPEAQATGKPGDLETIARLAYEMATHENARKTRRLETATGVAKFMFMLMNSRLSALNYAATAAALTLAQGLARGIDDPETAEADLLEFLRRREWRLDRKTSDRASPEDLGALAETLRDDLGRLGRPTDADEPELRISDSPWASLKAQLAATPPVGVQLQAPPDAPAV